MKLKILFSILFIFFAVLFVNGIRLAYVSSPPTPTPSPILNQKVLGKSTEQKVTIFETYTNSDDGYAINYPKSWSPPEIKDATLILSNSTLEGSLDISIQKIANPGNLTPKQFAISENVSGLKTNLVDEIINIQGVEGYKLIDASETTIYFPLYGNILKISGEYKGRDIENLNKLFNQITSSFRLLEKSELKNITGWKSYSNKAMQISFSYPPNFIPDTTDYTSENRILYLKKIEAPDPFYQIEIRLQDNFEKSDSEKLALDEVDKFPTLKNKITQEMIKVGDSDGVKVVGLPGKFQKIDIFVGVQDREYIITLNPYDPVLFPKLYPEATSLYYQFISSVKFL